MVISSESTNFNKNDRNGEMGKLETKKWRGTCCVALNCSNRQQKRSAVASSKRNGDITFHFFPSNFELRDEWTSAINRENFTPSSSSRICSEHFKETDFTTSGKRRRLKQDAIPSIFNFPSHLQQKSNTPQSTSITHFPAESKPSCRLSTTPSSNAKNSLHHDHSYFCNVSENKTCLRKKMLILLQKQKQRQRERLRQRQRQIQRDRERRAEKKKGTEER